MIGRGDILLAEIIIVQSEESMEFSYKTGFHSLSPILSLKNMWIEGLSNVAAATTARNKENNLDDYDGFARIKAFKEALLHHRKVSKAKRASPPFSSISRISQRPLAAAAKPSPSVKFTEDNRNSNITSRNNSSDLKKSNSSILLSQLTSGDKNKESYYGALSSSFTAFKNSVKSGGNIFTSERPMVRYTIFGDTISCLQIQDHLLLVSTQDVVKMVLAETRLKLQDSLNHSMTSKISSRIVMELRTMKCGTKAADDKSVDNCVAQIEDGNSEILKVFYRVNAIKTLKRQKLFNWKRLNWKHLEKVAMECIGNNETTTTTDKERDAKSNTGGIDLISQAASQLDSN